MACAQGALSRLLVEPLDGTFDVDSEIYDFLHEDLQKQGRLVGGRGITGSRSNYANRVREGAYSIGGKISTYTCSADLDLWLPRILGGAEAADVFDVADALPTFGVMVGRVSGVFQYAGCYIDKAIWRAQGGPGDGEPELVEQVLLIQAKTEDSTASLPTLPTLSVASNRRPYICSDCVLTIGSAFQFHDFVILVDNHLQPRWVNSLTPTAICPQDRTVMVRVTFPFTAADDAVLSGVYQLSTRATGVTATMVMTSPAAGCSTTFTFTGLQWAQVSPVVTGKEEIRLAVDFVARKTGSASELVVTNDSTAT